MKNIYIITIIITLFACGKQKPSTQNQAMDSSSTKEIVFSKQQLELMNIQLVKPELKMTTTTITSPGKVVVLSQYQASITAKISGTVEEINVLEGQKISKGQVLMKLSSQEFVQLQESYVNAKSEIDYLKADYDRQNTLRKENVVGEKDFQLVKSKYDGALSRMHAAEARLKILGVNASSLSAQQSFNPYYEVRSPLSGYLFKLPVSIGMSLNANTELAHVLNMDKFHADIFVYEKDINQIYEGQKVEIDFANSALANVNGEVEFISRSFDPIKRAIVIHVVFDAPKGLVLPDMTISATFHTKEIEQLIIPASALVRDEDKEYIFIANQTNDKTIFAKQEVKIASQNGDNISLQPDAKISTQTRIAKTGTLLIDGEMKKESGE